MNDWDQLREVGHGVSPPPFESLVDTAGRRDRRALTIMVTATIAVVTALGFGVALVNDDDDATIQPADEPSPSVSMATELVTLPEGVLALPDGDDVPVDAGRYHVPLDDYLAFEVDLPQDASSSSGGLYLASGKNVLKVELAGEKYGVPIDACTAQFVMPVGPTVRDLVEAIRSEPLYRVSRPEPVEIGGAKGTYLEIRVPAGYDALSCEASEVGMPGNPGTSNNMNPGYVGYWWILDVDGQRVVAQQFCDHCAAEEEDRSVATVPDITFTSTT
jgi:hypothetical protein